MVFFFPLFLNFYEFVHERYCNFVAFCVAINYFWHIRIIKICFVDDFFYNTIKSSTAYQIWVKLELARAHVILLPIVSESHGPMVELLVHV